MRSLKEEKSNKIILIDGMNLFHRCFYAYSRFTNSSGFPTGGVYGYLSSLLYITDKFNSNNIIVFWEGGHNWRNSEDKNYKSRESTESQYSEEDRQKFNLSFSAVNKILTEVGILQIMKYPHEADDLIYHVTTKYGENVSIVSNDKDFLQLVDDEKKISVYRPKDGGGYDEWKEKEVIKKFGVPSSQIANYLALAGDVSDNVKGVVGIGPVNAVKLINGGYITKSNIKQKLGKDKTIQFMHSLRLVKMKGILDNIELTSDDCYALIREFDDEAVSELIEDYEIRKFNTRDLKTLCNVKFKKEFVEKIIGIKDDTSNSY